MYSIVRSTLLVSALAAGAATIAQAQATQAPPAHIAIINAQKAVADTQEFKKAEAALEAKYKPRQQAIETLQSDLQKIQTQLNSPNLQEDRQSQLNAEGTQKNKELTRLTEDLQTDVNNDRQDILTKEGRQMTDIVSKIAADRGIDIVIDITNTIYFKPALEITADATAAYDKAYPAK